MGSRWPLMHFSDGVIFVKNQSIILWKTNTHHMKLVIIIIIIIIIIMIIMIMIIMISIPTFHFSHHKSLLS